MKANGKTACGTVRAVWAAALSAVLAGTAWGQSGGAERGEHKPSAPPAAPQAENAGPAGGAAAGTEAVRIEVRRDSLVVHEPDSRPFAVAEEELWRPGNDFGKLLDRMRSGPHPRYALLLLRPDSAPLQRKIRRLVSDCGVRMALEPFDGDDPTAADRHPQPDWTGKSPVFFECRDNRLFRIDPEKLKKTCDEKAAELFGRVGGDETEFFKQAGPISIRIDGQRLDFALSLAGSYLLFPDDSAEGHALSGEPGGEAGETWYGAQLSELDPGGQFVCLFVRPDSFRAFRRARALAEARGFGVACELLQSRDPISLGGLAGERIRPQ